MKQIMKQKIITPSDPLGLSSEGLAVARIRLGFVALRIRNKTTQPIGSLRSSESNNLLFHLIKN